MSYIFMSPCLLLHLVGLFLGVFVVFVMVNGIVSLISLSKLSLLVYRITKFIIVYNELPNSLMSFSSLLVAP